MIMTESALKLCKLFLVHSNCPHVEFIQHLAAAYNGNLSQLICSPVSRMDNVAVCNTYVLLS
jgi:hypothetical protein